MQLIEAILETEAKNLEKLAGDNIPSTSFHMEIVRSRSGVEAQLARHQATLPFLEGTKPPVTLSTATAALEPEDSFLDATIDELASLFWQKLRLPERSIFKRRGGSEACFFVLDEKMAREGSIILVSMQQACDDEEVERDENDEYTQRRRLAGEMVGIPYGTKLLSTSYVLGGEYTGKKDNRKFQIDAVRVGVGSGCKWADTIEGWHIHIDDLKYGCSKDGVYWGCEFDGKDPPPMEERWRRSHCCSFH